MDTSNIICPVCTLYLRPGITLKQHLSSHPKQKVIEALVRLSCDPFDGTEQEQEQEPKETTSNGQPSSTTNQQINTIVNQTWNQQSNTAAVTMPPTIPTPIQGNHLFIYQQSMSSTSTPQPNIMNVNPLSQQYIIPTILNPQMMPYVYQQQQQLIMSSNSCIPPMSRPPIPFSLPSSSSTPEAEESVTTQSEPEPIEDEGKNEELQKEKKEETEKPVTVVNEIKICQEYYDEGTEQDDDNDNDVPSPAASDWNLRVRSDLNKACQTNNGNSNTSPRSIEEELIDNEDPPKEIQPEYYFTNENESVPYTMTQTYDQSDPIYTSTNILQNHESLDFVEMDGVHMVMNDFSTNQIISQVENFENTHPDRNGVLMTIGGMVDNSNDQREDESRESLNVNIRADEKMPPRGELSGQESIGGASDITWNRVQYDSGSAICSSYDLIARETWDASDSSDVEQAPLQSRLPQNYNEQDDIDDDNNTPTIVSFSGPPLNFKCSTCGDAFVGSKERREHEMEKHPEKITNIIGADIGKKNVKKLVVKFKQDKTENIENNFDNVFTNKLKIENESVEPQLVQDTLDKPKEENDVNVDVKVICSICNIPCENLKALRLHKSTAHNINSSTRYKCSTCGETFPNDLQFTVHLSVHPLECKLCGKLFFRRPNMQMHMRRHLGIKPYKCDVCEKSFLTKQKLDEHRNTHTGAAPIKCHQCNETFRRHSNLVQHRNRHHLNIKRKVKDYICFCKEVFHSKKKLAWHMETHDPKPKSCTQCSEKFIHMASLTRHMRRAHNQSFLPIGHNSSENVECPICKGIYLKSSLDVHIRNHSGQRPFTCLICNKDFTTKWNLKLHKWTHASRISKPYKCDQCKGAFIRESDYISHMNSHKSVRPYTCNYCGAQFIRKYNCQRHVKEHENAKTFVCKVCGKTFHRSYYLKDHMRVHSGARPYSCHICGKTSTTKSNHNKHVQIHHAREPVSTEN